MFTLCRKPLQVKFNTLRHALRKSNIYVEGITTPLQLTLIQLNVMCPASHTTRNQCVYMWVVRVYLNFVLYTYVIKCLHQERCTCVHSTYTNSYVYTYTAFACLSIVETHLFTYNKYRLHQHRWKGVRM